MKKRRDNAEKIDELLQYGDGELKHLGNSKEYDELLAKYKELEKQANELEKKLDELNGEYGWVMVQFGGQIRELVKYQTEKEIDDIGMGILKKLVKGGFVSFKEDYGEKTA